MMVTMMMMMMMMMMMIRNRIKFDLFFFVIFSRTRDLSINCYKIWVYAPYVNENYI